MTGGPAPEWVAGAVAELESIVEQADKPAVYASLLHAAALDGGARAVSRFGDTGLDDADVAVAALRHRRTNCIGRG